MRRLWWLGDGTVVALIVAVTLAQTAAVTSDFWRDFVAWFSLFLTGLGLGYTVYQVTLIESTTRAAKQAAEQAREENRQRLFQFTAANAHQLIDAVSDDLERHEWGKAVIRLNNLADHTAQVGGQETGWRELVRNIREVAAQCHALESERRSRTSHVKWTSLLMDLRTRLDRLLGPFERME